ncbi:MAG: prolyl oligopeptidase family serine peptidase [Planctomycetia bacterium]|nr:prolyl oligopeptidase family serine peptidase [Planctomycetia bacterium]
MTRLLPASIVFLASLAPSTRADGPADNLPGSVRRVPKLGITISPDVRKEFQEGLAALKASCDSLANGKNTIDRDLLTDVIICHKAVSDALTYQEFFSAQDVAKARELLALGKSRVAALAANSDEWKTRAGLVVRGYVSKIDGSVQPYGLVVPDTYATTGTGRYRLDVWCHGRGETLSEVNFLDERRKRKGEFTPPDTIVLHPYGRYCNANKFAGEVDVLEAIESVRRRYKIDPDRIAIRGFSMGGASAWQFAVHYSDRWFAANPGAGFAETPRFLDVFQKETLQPTWYEKKLWHLYDCTDWSENLAQCPTVAYSGELDNQKQAADVMAEALAKEGIGLTHVIGPKTKHAYEPAAKIEVGRRLASLAEVGRERFPSEVRFTTYTLKYNRMDWVTVDGLEEHWKQARVRANVVGGQNGKLVVKTENVNALTAEFPPGYAPRDRDGKPIGLVDIDGGAALSRLAPRSDRSFKASFIKTDGQWSLGTPPGETLRKKHDLQGPIDDAFMDSFLIVRPTGKSRHGKFQDWSGQEMTRAVEHWRRHFRGEARVKDDTQVDDRDLAGSNLVLWGDPESNRVLERIADRLPIRWDSERIRVGDRSFEAENHALILIYPNPLNPEKYVVLNSGFTFRDYDYLNNARQVPKLPDWAVIDLRTPPDSRAPGKVVAADFFDERWKLKPETP